MPYILNGQGERLDVMEGDDVAAFLSIQKYEPPIPTSMAGQCFAVDGLPKYDIEAYEKYPGAIQSGEPVVATEKLHGTFTGFSLFADGRTFEDAPEGVLVYSKGLGAKGLTFKHVAENDSNLYMRVYRELREAGVWERVRTAVQGPDNMPFHLFGETFGPGVQDLHYGQKRPAFRLFDVYMGEWGRGEFLCPFDLKEFARMIGVETVPILYEGPFDVPTLEALRDGKDSLSGSNVREGLVVRPVIERRQDDLGRVILKMVSPDYKLRKGGGEELS